MNDRTRIQIQVYLIVSRLLMALLYSPAWEQKEMWMFSLILGYRTGQNNNFDTFFWTVWCAIPRSSVSFWCPELLLPTTNHVAFHVGLSCLFPPKALGMLKPLTSLFSWTNSPTLSKFSVYCNPHNLYRELPNKMCKKSFGKQMKYKKDSILWEWNYEQDYE